MTCLSLAGAVKTELPQKLTAINNDKQYKLGKKYSVLVLGCWHLQMSGLQSCAHGELYSGYGLILKANCLFLPPKIWNMGHPFQWRDPEAQWSRAFHGNSRRNRPKARGALMH